MELNVSVYWSQLNSPLYFQVLIDPLSSPTEKQLLFSFIPLFWPCHVLAGSWFLVLWSGIKPVTPVVEAQSPNHWTARELFLTSS